uniref:Ig-like domain-containing protein n=1 Tax=Lates calcarifer TaxID=8187 RepID=A0A4W6DPX4_LATCA
MFWFKPQLRSLSAFVFHHAVFLLLIRSCAGLSQVIVPMQPIVVTIGDDIILPCHLEPATDAVAMTCEWSRSDLNPRFVHVWHEREELVINQHPSYKGRTSLSTNKLKLGDISLKLSGVKLSDNGTYKCFIPELRTESTIKLVVGLASSPVINLAGNDRDTGAVVLECESKGWYPEPEVLWLDSEGNLLSAGPTETVRGPDDLYTVSSRVTVEKRHSNSFTCRVQQNNINQTREAHIHVEDDFFNICSSSALHITIGLLVVAVVITAAVCVIWKWRHSFSDFLCKDIKRHYKDENEQGGEHLVAKRRKKVRLQKEIKCWIEQLQEQLEEDKKLSRELEKKMRSVDAEVTEKMGDKTKNKADGYLKLKTILTDVKHKLEDQQMGHEKLLMDAKKALEMIEEGFDIKEGGEKEPSEVNSLRE